MRRKIALSKNKQEWAERFKPQTIKGSALARPASIESKFNAEIQREIDRMLRVTQKRIEGLFTSDVAIESHVVTDASVTSRARILMNALKSEFMAQFAEFAKPIAERMVSRVSKESATNLKRSLKEISGGLAIKTDFLKSGEVGEIVKATIGQGVSLIKSIPDQYLSKVEEAVYRSIVSGNGLQDLVPFLEKQSSITKRHARNMALDQTRKAYNGINAGRMKAAGVDKFEWIHSGGGKQPRQEHVDMSGNIYSLSNPPMIDSKTGERGIPGQLPNCRCTMRPIVSFDDE